MSHGKMAAEWQACNSCAIWAMHVTAQRDKREHDDLAMLTLSHVQPADFVKGLLVIHLPCTCHLLSVTFDDVHQGLGFKYEMDEFSS
jgi:hypothetical protein